MEINAYSINRKEKNMYTKNAEFKINKDKKNVSELPLPLRQLIYKDIMELIVEADIFIKDGGHPGYNSEVWPVTYIFSEDTVMVIISILDMETREIVEKLVLNIPRENLEKLNEK